MAKPTIVAAAVGKRFLLHHKRATSLKERLLLHRQSSSEEFWALRGVDLEIGAGQTVGLIGLGHIGRRLIELLAPFRCTVLAHDPYVQRELALAVGAQLTSLERVMSAILLIGLIGLLLDRGFDFIARKASYAS